MPWCVRHFSALLGLNAGSLPTVPQISAVLLPISLLWFAFTSPETVPWPASVVSNVLFGIGLLGMMTCIVFFLISSVYSLLG